MKRGMMREEEMESILGAQNQIVSGWISSCKNKSYETAETVTVETDLFLRTCKTDGTSAWLDVNVSAHGSKEWSAQLVSLVFTLIITVFIFQKL